MTSKSFIEQYQDQETLAEIANIPIEVIDHLIKDGFMRSNDDNDEYVKFYHLFVVAGVPLCDIPKESGLSERTCSAWASDLVPSFVNYYKEHYCSSNNKQEKTKIQSSSEGFDIYEYAKTCNADYYDMYTGYTYLVQNYNQALKFGLPTPGIAVMYDGELIGYARKI